MNLRKDVLFRMLEIPSPSGFEEKLGTYLMETSAEFADRVDRDVHGNVYVEINPDAPFTFMLAGHMDEIGYMVTHINDEGFLYFSPIGGPDRLVTEGQRVRVYSFKEDRWIPGVVGRKPIHLMTAEEREKTRKFHEMWIDIGVENGEEARNLVEPGSPVILAWGPEEITPHRLVARGMDDRIGAFVVIEAARIAKELGVKGVRVVAVATVQEEVGLRGARTSAYRLNPDVGIAVDVGFATDVPGHEKEVHRLGKMYLGKGPIVARGANITPAVWRRLLQVSEAHQIPVQIEGSPGATGTDANVIQITREGVATGLVSIPNRYMHTPCEMVDLRDVEGAVQLLAQFAASLEKDPLNIP